MKGLSPGLRLKHETFISNYCNIFLEPMGSALMDFTKGLSLGFGSATVRLIGSGLISFVNSGSNIAAIIHSPVQNVKWLKIRYKYI